MPGQLVRDTKAIPVFISDDDGNPVAIGGGGGGGGAVTQPTASNLNAQVVGNAANGTADSGNPVKVGGVYNGTLPALTTGQRGDVQLNPNGAVQVAATVQGTWSDNQSLGSYGSLMRRDAAGGLNLGVYPFVFDGTSAQRQRGDTNGTYSVSKGSGGLATAQVSVGTTATQIVAARAGRGSVKITNLGTTDVFIGVAGVTATTGDLLPGTKGASIVIPASVAVFGVAATAQTVSVMEVF